MKSFQPHVSNNPKVHFIDTNIASTRSCTTSLAGRLLLEVLVYGRLDPLLVVRLVCPQLWREHQHRQVRQSIHITKQLRNIVLQML